MRLISLFSLIIFLGCAPAKKTASSAGKLNGTWVPVSLEIDGAQLPKASFEKQKLIISDSAYTYMAESVDKGVVRYEADKIDIYGKEGVNAGKHFTAIYKMENGQLRICYNLAGDKYPESFETKGKPMYFMAVFKKEY